MRRRLVCTVIGARHGGSAWTATTHRLGYKVGRAAARAHYVVVTGGHSGVMESAAAGAHDVGGLTVGVLRTDDKATANPYLDVVIPTGMGVARNVITALAADVVVALPGSDGTLQELAFALDYGRPVLAIGAWQSFVPRVSYYPIDVDPTTIEEWLIARAAEIVDKENVRG